MSILPYSWLETVKTVGIAALDTGIDGVHPYDKSRWKRPECQGDGDQMIDRGYADFLGCPTLEENQKTPVDMRLIWTGIVLQFAPHAKHTLLVIAR